MLSCGDKGLRWNVYPFQLSSAILNDIDECFFLKTGHISVLDCILKLAKR